jgi:hypothetical protein
MIWLSYAAAAAVVLLLGALWVISSRETPGPKPAIAAEGGGRQTPATRRVPPAGVETATPAPAASGAETLAQTPAPEPKPERKAPATAVLPAPAKSERLANAQPSVPGSPP